MNIVKISLASVLALAVLIAGTLAYGELQEYDTIEGRDYHARLHKRGRCEGCHTSKEPTGYPEDGACLECHDMNELVLATTPEAEEEAWQNPHNNLHYGEDVPCVECHGEHISKKPLCASCHNFDYPYHEE